MMNIYVGNLSYQASEEELRNTFSEFGEVASVKIIKDKFSGESRGFGFVEMAKREDAEKAIAQLDGKDLKGRILRVTEARPKTSHHRGGPGGGGGGNGGPRGGGRRSHSQNMHDE